MMQVTAATTVFIALLISNSVTAAEATAPVTGSVSVAQIINLLAGLLLVLLTFFAVVYLLKRLAGLNGMNRGHMKIVDAMHLGTKERLLIVKVVDKHILLGVSPRGIHALHVLTEDVVERSDAEDMDPRTPFTQLLAKLKLKGA